MAGFTVRKIELFVAMSYPAQVMVRLTGDVPDGCTEIDSVAQSRSGNEITLTVATKRQGESCTTAVRRVEREVWLTDAFESGNYVVRAHGVEEKFTV